MHCTPMDWEGTKWNPLDHMHMSPNFLETNHTFCVTKGIISEVQVVDWLLSDVPTRIPVVSSISCVHVSSQMVFVQGKLVYSYA